jgi:outer membrane protein OmpA-like peptidoglycan-associated protein
VFSIAAPAQEDRYVHVGDDLQNGMELQDIAKRAFDNSGDYWEYAHGHDRDGHDHPGHAEGMHHGTDEELSAGEAVSEIFNNAAQNRSNAHPRALDIVEVTLAVIDAWPDCEDTFDAVRSAVALLPGRADEIVANVAVKRDCNCSNGGLWVDRQLDRRIRLASRQAVLDVPVQCSCSQVAMYAGISGLPENRESTADMDEAQQTELIARMTERVTTITERTSAIQNRNDWECGCADVNIAAAMQGIGQDDLRDGTYEGLAQRYAEDAGDTGLIVDSFGVVGLHPIEYWGGQPQISRDNTLRRKSEVYRGDNLILDPFNPETEFVSHGDRQFGHVDQHALTADNLPTDLIISEYIEGWNEEALKRPENEREPEQRNRVIELYNGSDRTIDLGNDQYFLEIYAAPGTETRTSVTPPVLVRKTISLESDVTFEFDKSDIRAEADKDLRNVVKVLNEVDLFSEILIVGHTCDMGPDEYNRALSRRRAESVKDFLISAGLEVDTIRTEGHGEMEPRVPNDSVANRNLNRRIEITFVTKEGEVLEPVVAGEGEGEGGAPGRREYTFLVPIPGEVVSDVESTPVRVAMVDGEYYRGDTNPRQVIGLNGAIEPGETFVVAFNQSDEVLTDAAHQVTGQLDFKPNETLVVRRLGGEMALNCRAQNYAYVTNYPVLPVIYFADDDSQSRALSADDIASPN